MQNRSVAPSITAFMRHFIVGIAIAMTAGNAGAQEINVEFDENVDFTRFRTFAIREGKIASKSPALNSPLTKQRLRDDLEQALTKKGLTLVEGKADLNVNFHFGSERTMETKALPAGWRGRGTRYVKEAQSEGTLIVDLHDTSTQTLVWRGIAVEAEPNPLKLADKLGKIIDKTIGKYPPKKKRKS